MQDASERTQSLKARHLPCPFERRELLLDHLRDSCDLYRVSARPETLWASAILAAVDTTIPLQLGLKSELRDHPSGVAGVLKNLSAEGVSIVASEYNSIVYCSVILSGTVITCG